MAKNKSYAELLEQFNPTETRFWSKVKKSADADGCWEWMGALTVGYGRFHTSYPKRTLHYAHVFSYRMNVGAVATGLRVLHRCDNRKCVRPDHLFLGTQKDNIYDCISKKRAWFQKG